MPDPTNPSEIVDDAESRATAQPNPCCVANVPVLDITRQPGARWTCPLCGTGWVWDVDETGGGAWWPATS